MGTQLPPPLWLGNYETRASAGCPRDGHPVPTATSLLTGQIRDPDAAAWGRRRAQLRGPRAMVTHKPGARRNPTWTPTHTWRPRRRRRVPSTAETPGPGRSPSQRRGGRADPSGQQPGLPGPPRPPRVESKGPGINGPDPPPQPPGQRGPGAVGAGPGPQGRRERAGADP